MEKHLKETFTFVALPEKQVGKSLNDLRLYFNRGGFKKKRRSFASDAHITLARGIFSSDIVKRSRIEIAKILEGFAPFEITWEELMNEKRSPTEEHPYNYRWIALAFDDSRLRALSKALDEWLVQEKLSDTFNYVGEVKDVVASNKAGGVVADHLNICNYCLPERAGEACSLILNKMPKKFFIRKVAFRHMDGAHAWELAL